MRELVCLGVIGVLALLITGSMAAAFARTARRIDEDRGSGMPPDGGDWE